MQRITILTWQSRQHDSDSQRGRPASPPPSPAAVWRAAGGRRPSAASTDSSSTPVSSRLDSLRSQSGCPLSQTWTAGRHWSTAPGSRFPGGNIIMSADEDITKDHQTADSSVPSLNEWMITGWYLLEERVPAGPGSWSGCPQWKRSCVYCQQKAPRPSSITKRWQVNRAKWSDVNQTSPWKFTITIEFNEWSLTHCRVLMNLEKR